MSKFNKYVFPFIYGLIVYITVRLLTDTRTGDKYWNKPLSLIFTELSLVVICSYTDLYLKRKALIYFDRRYDDAFSKSRIIKELGVFLLITFILVNLIFTPFTALTDDGLSLSDFAFINTIPPMFAFMYYGIIRSNAFYKAYIEHKIKLERLTIQHLQSELEFLKAQYHPHFLFNALNTVYFQMDENVSAAKKSVETLSELLRYQLYSEQKVSLHQEMNYLKNYVELQKLRSSGKLNLVIKLEENINGEQIYPMLLLPLVENAFKYIGGDYMLKIEALLKDDIFFFLVNNSVPPNALSDTHQKGIGLKNLKRRLNLLYPDKYNLKSCLHGNKYETLLSIQI